MENYLAELVLVIDYTLFLIALSLSFLGIIHIVIKESIEKRRQAGLKKIILNLQRLTVNGKELITDGCVSLMRKATHAEVLGIAKYGKEKILPEMFSQKFGECIDISGKISQIEQLAERPKNKWRRIEAIITLGYLNPPNALSILKRTLLDRDEDVAYFSMLGLGRIKSAGSAHALLEAIKMRIFSGYKIASVLETFPPNVVEQLIQATQDPDPVLRFWAIKLLLRFKARQYADEISALTKDKLPDIRAAACECLGEIGQESVRAAAKACLHDSEWYVKIHAIRSLEKIFGPDSIPDLANFIKDANWLIQETVKKIMMKHIEQALPYLKKLLHDDDQNVKNSCLEILDGSGYTNRILQDIISENSGARDNALQLLKAMLSAGAHFGLERFLSEYPPDTYAKILNVIAAIDKEKAEHIDKKIKGEIVEV